MIAFLEHVLFFVSSVSHIWAFDQRCLMFAVSWWVVLAVAWVVVISFSSGLIR
jgi:hypothetical protein